MGSFAGVLGLAVLGWAAPSAAAGLVVNASSDLVPSVSTAGGQTGFVTGGRAALYTASWTDEGTATLTNTLIVVTLPPGSTVRSADPDVCTARMPPNPADPVVVSCPRDNLHGGGTLTQRLFVQTTPVNAETQSVVTSYLQGKEAGNDQNKSHVDTFPTPPRPVTILAGAADAAGACTQLGELPLGTQPGVSAANPLVTAASLSGATDLFCTPITLVERHRSNPTEGCGAGVTCTVDLAVTEAPEVTAPVRLTFAFLSNNKNLTWYKNGAAVADCPGATQLPAELDACATSRSKQGSGVVSLGVLWRGGPDPTWTGR